MGSSYYCKLSDIHQFCDYPSNHVRWLDPDVDYHLIKEYFRYFDIRNTTDSYFGICLDRIKDDWSVKQTKNGKLCAYILDHAIVSFAAVEYTSPDAWEIRAVSSRPDCRKKGYSKCVCSFIARYILEQGKQAICETNIENEAMKRVTKQIGMIEYDGSMKDKDSAEVAL